MDWLTGMRVFARVVEAGGFSRAAEDLGMTQPTVTKHVAAIEKALDCRLLNRNTRGVAVTEDGAAYYERCKATLREFELAMDVGRDDGAETRGQLRVTTSLAFGRLVLAPALIDFMAMHPKLRVDLDCDDRFIDLVASGRDLAVRMGSLADSSYGVSGLGVNPWIMVAAPSYLAARGAPRAVADLAAHDCIVYSSVQGNDVWRFLGPEGPHETAQLETPLRSNNLSVILAAALAGRGLAILPHYVAARALARGGLRTIMDDHELPSQRIQAVTPSPRLAPRKVTLFVAYLRKRFSGSWWLEVGEPPSG
jgi:DNA-binding transcriptional LysR family regulator